MYSNAIGAVLFLLAAALYHFCQEVHHTVEELEPIHSEEPIQVCQRLADEREVIADREEATEDEVTHCGFLTLTPTLTLTLLGRHSAGTSSKVAQATLQVQSESCVSTLSLSNSIDGTPLCDEASLWSLMLRGHK